MQWYYVKDGERQGPVSEADLRQLLQTGEIKNDTLIWHEGMADWEAAELHITVEEPADGESAEEKEQCSQCRRQFPVSEIVEFGGTKVCVNCKPDYVQRMREGVNANAPKPSPGASRYTAPRSNSSATTGLVLAIIGVFCCNLLAIPGLILSIKGLNEYKKDPSIGGQGVAIAGIVVSIIGLIIFVLGIILQIAGGLLQNF